MLRSHQIGRDGTLRDTVVFSILAAEWPTVRLSLTEGCARAGERALAAVVAGGAGAGCRRGRPSARDRVRRDAGPASATSSGRVSGSQCPASRATDRYGAAT